MLNEEAKKERVVYVYVDENVDRVAWDMYFEDIEQDENIIIYGNRDYRGTNSNILKKFDDLYNDYDYYCYNNCYYRNITDYVNTYLKKDNGKKFSKKELSIIKKICENNMNMENYEYYETMLSIVKGKPYERRCLKGYRQSDWQYIYAPKDIDEKYLNYIEAIYFGKGNEVAISDDLTFEDCYYNFYIDYIIWDEDKLIEAIKQDTGADKVVLCERITHTTYEYVEKGAE